MNQMSKFMTLPACVIDELSANEMVMVTGGIGDLDLNNTPNNGDGVCTGTNNGTGKCNGANNSGGTCCGSNNSAGTCGGTNNFGGKCGVTIVPIDPGNAQLHP